MSQSNAKRKRLEKHDNLLALTRECIRSGKYVVTKHTLDRCKERNISFLEIIDVLNKGKHEKSKDKFNEIFHAWDYSIRGKTVEDRELRIIVSFDRETKLLLITAIDLEKES